MKFRTKLIIGFSVDVYKRQAYTLHTKMEKTGSFECSNQDLNQLAHNILWGLKGNFVDVPTDLSLIHI